MAEVLTGDSLKSLIGASGTAIEGAKTSSSMVGDLNNLAQNIKEILQMVQKKQDPTATGVVGVNPSSIGTAPIHLTGGVQHLSAPAIAPQAPKQIVIDQKILESEIDLLFKMAEPFKTMSVGDALANYDAFKPQILGSLIQTIKKVTRLE